MITITYNGSIADITDAVVAANDLLKNAQFFNDIATHGHFDFTNTTPAVISGLMQNAVITMRVVPYRSINRRVFGYDDPNNPDLIHINLWRNEWSKGGLVNTMLHESVHAVDNLTPAYDFGHGDNSSVGKENSAPYWIGNRAEELVNGGGEPTEMTHDAYPEDTIEIL